MTKKKASNSLADARQALDEIEAAVRDLTQRRTKLLIAGDDKALDLVDAELARLRKASERQSDRIGVLEEQAKAEEVAAVARRRAELVGRFAKKLAAADEVASELQDCIANADRLFRKVISLRAECLAAFPVGHSSHVRALSSAPDGCALTGGSIKILLQWEIYRIGARPTYGGQAGELKQQDFPGGIPERMEWALQQDKLTPFADRLRAASRAAVEVMRTTGISLPTPPEAVAPPTPAPAATPAPAPAPTSAPAIEPAAPAAVAAASNGGAAPVAQSSDPLKPVRTPAQERLASLLARQAVLAEDISEEGDRLYQENLALIVRTTDEIEQMKG